MKIFIYVTSLFVFIGCAQPFSPNSNNNDTQKTDHGSIVSPPPSIEPQIPPSGPDPQPLDPDPSDPINELLACYKSDLSENCFPSVSLNVVEENSNDYNYPNPMTSPNFPANRNPNYYVPPSRLIEVNQSDQHLHLSDNFIHSELLQARKGPFGIISRPALEKFQSIRSELQKAIHPTSVFRGPAYNKSIGGATWSRHMYGDAFDFFAPRASLNKLAELCRAHQASYVEVYRSHIHCDWRSLKKDSLYFPKNPSMTLSTLSSQDIYANRVRDIVIHTSPLTTQSNKSGFSELSFSFPAEDNPKDLRVQWEVNQNGNRSLFESNTISLPPGKYNILLTVGGILSKQIDIEL